MPVPDPLAYLPPPSGLTAQANPGSLSSGTTTLQPGSYTGSLSITGTATVHLTSGIYAIQGGGFTFTSTGTLDTVGGGVMIYVSPVSNSTIIPSINIAAGAGGVVNLSPLTTGAYQGITIFQDRAAKPPVWITGNSSYNITGTIYAPSDVLKITSKGDPSVGSQYMGRIVQVIGSANWQINQVPHPSHTRIINLVE